MHELVPARRQFASTLVSGSALLCLPTVALSAQAPLPPPGLDQLAAEVLEVLARFSRLISQHDLGLADEFSDDAVLVGSEVGEVTVGREAFTALLKRAYAKEHTVSWEWETPVARRLGDLVWFFVEAQVVVVTAGKTERAPYRVSGVLEWRNARWIWRHYHGAEPARS